MKVGTKPAHKKENSTRTELGFKKLTQRGFIN
jgi:hypothetical protein